MLQRTRPGPVTETPATTPDQSDHDARTIVDPIVIDFARATHVSSISLISDWMVVWQRKRGKVATKIKKEKKKRKRKEKKSVSGDGGRMNAMMQEGRLRFVKKNLFYLYWWYPVISIQVNRRWRCEIIRFFFFFSFLLRDHDISMDWNDVAM